ncbi:MAG: AEC family transporter [Clostridia bacterium]|nr:AEC family transporter [Clostridia bacterium]
MGMIYLKVLIIMLVLAAFALPGFALKKLKMIGEGGTYTLSNVLLYVCQPALVIKSFCVFSETDFETVTAINRLVLLKNFGISFGFAVVSLLLMLAVSKLVFIKAKDKSAARIYSYIAVFSNCGFLGVPFVDAFTDGNPLAIMYVMVFNVAFIILCWTVGVVLITGDIKQMRPKKILLNPAILASVVAAVLFFVPEINFFMIDQVKGLGIFPEYLGYCTAPLSMIIVGIRLAETPAKSLFCRKGVYISGGLRLIVAPFLTLLIVLPFAGFFGKGAEFGFEEYVYIAPVIAMAMSPAASVVAMAETFNGDKDTATAAFVTNTILSVVTIPCVITAVVAIFGITV